MTNLPPAEKVMMLQTKSRNLFSRRQLAAGMECLLDGLRELGVDLKGEYSEDEAKTRHLAIRQDILDAGLEHIKDMPVAENETCNLRSTLLSEYAVRFMRSRYWRVWSLTCTLQSLPVCLFYEPFVSQVRDDLHWWSSKVN